MRQLRRSPLGAQGTEHLAVRVLSGDVADDGQDAMSERPDLRMPCEHGHESGYRYIRLVGVDASDNRYDLGEWHDHLVVEPKCNIDVTESGVMRIMPWSGVKFYTHPQSGVLDFDGVG
jgi:hypothetical protein